jgi:hypothetical protein
MSEKRTGCWGLLWGVAMRCHRAWSAWFSAGGDDWPEGNPRVAANAVRTFLEGLEGAWERGELGGPVAVARALDLVANLGPESSDHWRPLVHVADLVERAKDLLCTLSGTGLGDDLARACRDDLVTFDALADWCEDQGLTEAASEARHLHFLLLHSVEAQEEQPK